MPKSFLYHDALLVQCLSPLWRSRLERPHVHNTVWKTIVFKLYKLDVLINIWFLSVILYFAACLILFYTEFKAEYSS